MKKNLSHLLLGIGISGSVFSQTVITGPSTTVAPYFIPSVSGYSVTSILTTPNIIGGYKMCGIPDGIGAYDNGNGSFTLLMNHEIPAASGVARAHGSTGAFVSKWVINKNTLAVNSGTDLIQNANLWTGTTYTTYNATNPSTLAAFSRFCSADLPATTAYYNSATGKGTQERIFMNGEESGSEGRILAHISTGPNAGSTYELPYLGKYSSENACASPYRSDKTIVIGMDDSSPLGQVYVYIGNKSASGSEINRAGLVGGKLYGVAVAGMLNEVSASFPAANTTFSLIDLGQVQAITGASLNTLSNNQGVTNFLRPEDGCWDPVNYRDFYFNTTNAFNSPSRVWRLRFNNIDQPELGGTITAVLDGTEGQQMLDNMTIDNSGHIYLCEDVGNNAWLGRILEYNIATDVLTPLGQHDPNLFLSTSTSSLTQDEEASGIIDAQSVLGPGKLLFVTQAHYAISGDAYEGGQLLVLHSPSTFNNNPEINVQGNSVSIPAGSGLTTSANNTGFGIINLNTPVVKTFVIQNAGPGTLTVTNINFTGTNAGDFTLVSPPAYPLNIAANASQTISVQFVPVIAGTRAATLNIYNNDFSESIYDFALDGIGAVPEIDVLGNSISIAAGTSVTSSSNNTDFGTTIINTPVTKNFLLQNTGNGTLTVNSITITGANSSEFSLVGAPSFPLVMIGGASQVISVKFLPVATGTRTAKITINNTDANEANYDFMVQGISAIDAGINKLDAKAEFAHLFPNPVKDEAVITLNLDNNEHVSIHVIDVLGRNVMTLERDLNRGEQSLQLSTNALANGEYFIKLNTAGKATTLKMVVSH